MARGPRPITLYPQSLLLILFILALHAHYRSQGKGECYKRQEETWVMGLRGNLNIKIINHDLYIIPTAYNLVFFLQRLRYCVW